MLKEKEFPVYGDNGLRGTLLSAARFLDPSPEKRIRLEDGREIVVPSSALAAQPDGSYYLKMQTADLPANRPEQVSQAEQPRPKAAEAPQAQTSPAQPSPVPPPPPHSSAAEPPRAKAADQPAAQPPPSSPVSGEARRPREPEPRQVFADSATGALFREDCEVERVPVKRMLDKPAEIRQDGDTLIIPLMEEVLVVEKRLMLREELHIKRRRENKPDDARTPIPLDQLPR